MDIPNCTYLVECNGCSHPKQKKFAWILNRTCVLVTGEKNCELQNEHLTIEEYEKKNNPKVI
jgi:hypothetical protein